MVKYKLLYSHNPSYKPLPDRHTLVPMTVTDATRAVLKCSFYDESMSAFVNSVSPKERYVDEYCWMINGPSPRSKCGECCQCPSSFSLLCRLNRL